MSPSNPAVIQYKPTSTSVPIFLIHDGGGTIFSYYALGDLDRNVYGIYNSDPAVKSTWRDGFSAIAQEYCAMVQDIHESGAIILAGWSLGGIIALEMSLILSQETDVEVIGVVLIETIYPELVRRFDGHITETDVPQAKSTSKETQRAILKGLVEGAEAVKAHKISPDEKYPPTVLMRARDPMPSRETQAVPPMLGWDEDGHDIVKIVYEILGHHYSIFESQNVPQLTAHLSEVCTMLENGVWS